MPSMNVPVRVVGLRLDGEKLQLEVEDVGDEEWALEGTQEDLPAFKKLFGKTLPARLTIGADEDTQTAAAADPEHEEIKRQLEAEKARGVELEKRLNESLEKLGHQIEQLPTPATAKLAPDHPVAKTARGALTVLREQAEKHYSNAKGSDSAKWSDQVRTAREALLKLEQLVAPEKPANGKLALAPPPTVA